MWRSLVIASALASWATSPLVAQTPTGAVEALAWLQGSWSGEATDAGTVYFASPRSAPPTAFKLIETGDKRVVFENKNHDFPQRILYWTDAKGALHARIEGPQGGKTVAEEWVWTRAK